MSDNAALSKDNQVPNLAYFQALEDRVKGDMQDVLTDVSKIIYDVTANEDLDKNPKSSTRYLLDEARFSNSWKYAS